MRQVYLAAILVWVSIISPSSITANNLNHDVIAEYINSVLATTSTNDENIRNTRQNEDAPSSSCSGNGYLYPSKYDCRIYFLCRQGNPIRYRCPFPTQFSTRVKRCVWTGKPMCSGPSRPPIQPPPRIQPMQRATSDDQGEVYQDNSVYPQQSYSEPDPYNEDSSYATNSNKHSKNYQTTDDSTAVALRTWINHAFIDSFFDNLIPTDKTKVRWGSRIYESLLENSSSYSEPSSYSNQYPSKLISTIYQNITLDEIDAFISSWADKGYIVRGEETIQKSIITHSPSTHSSLFFNTIREHVALENADADYTNTNDEYTNSKVPAIIYGITGLLQLSSKYGHLGEVRGTVLNTFKKFPLGSHYPIHTALYTRSTQTKDCVMWKQFCSASLTLGSAISGDSGSALMAFMRNATLTEFVKENAGVKKESLSEAIKLARLLPGELFSHLIEVHEGKGNGLRADQSVSRGRLGNGGQYAL